MFMTQRFEYIDQLKGLTILLVVIGNIIVFCGLGCDNNFIRNITMMNMCMLGELILMKNLLFSFLFSTKRWQMNN